MKNHIITAGSILVFAALLIFSFTSETSDGIFKSEKEIDYGPFELVSQTVFFEDGTEAILEIPQGFNITVAAEGLGKARFITKSPDGRFFIPDMVDYALSNQGKIFILDDFNQETGKFETRHTYLSGLRGPNNVAFYTDSSGKDWIYISLTAHLVRYAYSAGDLSPQGPAEIVTTFPNSQNLNADNIVWHITRTMLFDNDTLYVSVGSGCNLCEQPSNELRSMILKMNPDGSNVEIYAEGIKNAVGMEIVDGELYVTENGTDHLGDDAPDDLFLKVKQGAHYGWPYCYEVNGEKLADNTLFWERKNISCENDVPMSLAAFAPHAGPLGVEWFNSSHPHLNETFLVALQGSWNPQIGNGYQVVQITKDGEQRVFIDNFQTADGKIIGKPVDIFQDTENSFFLSEDLYGKIYYISSSI